MHCTDVADYTLEAAKKFGATDTINILGKDNWVDEVKAELGAFDKVLIAVGVPGIVNQAISLVRKGGRIVTIAMFHGEQSLPFN